jgi:hypothetical protein
MKKLFLIAIIAFLNTAAFTACTKKTDPAPTTVTSSFSATLGGAGWSAATINGSIYQGSYINVKGTASDGSILQITMPLDIKAGSYSIGPGTENTVALTYGGTAYAASQGNGGTLTISSNDGNVIKGSFSKLTMHDTYFQKYENNCSGSFVTKYQ